MCNMSKWRIHTYSHVLREKLLMESSTISSPFPDTEPKKIHTSSSHHILTSVIWRSLPVYNPSPYEKISCWTCLWINPTRNMNGSSGRERIWMSEEEWRWRRKMKQRTTTISTETQIPHLYLFTNNYNVIEEEEDPKANRPNQNSNPELCTKSTLTLIDFS